MESTGLNELREEYLSFFEGKGHLRLPSFSLVPQGDKSLLLINSGMAPMKKYFTGEAKPPRSRVTTCQKCIRTPDIERVGHTARHGTFFEMLGNFSFGDYFKEEAILWAWEFFIDVLKLPPEKLYCSIYTEDDEAFDIWTKLAGVSPSHIVRLGKEDNFWEHGAGPCGPCSEIYFDRGPEYGCGRADCAPGCDCDRFMEVWNNVFTQFSNDGNGVYTPLKKTNIDTGMGLERLACVMQGVTSLFDVDTVKRITDKTAKIAGVKYGEKPDLDISLRVIADHIRGLSFMIGDGIMPSNEGRGYVLRRLIRRALRHGRLLSVDRPFLCEAAQAVLDENVGAYPELSEKRDFIMNVIRAEEESFDKTVDKGLLLLNSMIEAADSTCLSGDDAFKLSDTFGFPLDLTEEILKERGMSVDRERFEELVKGQKQRARAARMKAGADAWHDSTAAAAALKETEFSGYDELSLKARVLEILIDSEPAQSADFGVEAEIVLDRTPFYAESGGQAGDRGLIECEGFSFETEDTVKTQNGVVLHRGTVTKGLARRGDLVTATVSAELRAAAERNHSCAHLLQAALREVLGTHVEQAGQFVSSEALRFDFSHYNALCVQELQRVEDRVNEIILQGLPVEIRQLSLEEAKAEGAMALFGEKYGSTVRTVRMGDFSFELCGGTHVKNTSLIGLFKITGESSVAAGIRRIEAVSGFGVSEYIRKRDELIARTASILKTNNIFEIDSKAESLSESLREAAKRQERLLGELSKLRIGEMLEKAEDIGGLHFIAGIFEGLGGAELRKTADEARDRDEKAVAVFADLCGAKLSFACACGARAVESGAHAGRLAKAAAQAAGGNGGGRADSASAGGRDAAKAKEALGAAREALLSMLKEN